MGRASERAGIVGLAAFLAVDVVLVGLALGTTRTPASGAGSPVGRASASVAGSAATPGQPTTAASGVTPTTGTTAAGPHLQVAPLSVGVVAIDGSTAMRFTVGSCAKGGSVVDVTRDGGATWSARSTPFDSVVRVRVKPNQSLFSVGANRASGCVPALRQSTSLTGAWGSAVKASTVWFRDPRDPSSVGLPTGGTGQPCQASQIVDLAISDTGAAVLCGSGDVLVTTTGAQWQTIGTVAGALALAVDAKTQPYAVTQGVAGCAGLAVVRPASPATPVGCIPTDLKGVDPGSVALSVSAQSGWLRAGPTTYRASASLSDWKKTA